MASMSRNEQRLEDGIHAVYAAMQRGRYEHAHELAKVVFYGGDVCNPLDFERAEVERQRIRERFDIRS